MNTLDTPVDRSEPPAKYRVKLAIDQIDFARWHTLRLFWRARREMIHAGPIGLPRRLLGLPPIW
jgi:hypothetical protein